MKKWNLRALLRFLAGVAIFSLITSIILKYTLHPSQPESFKPENISILRPDTTQIVTPEIAKQHNETLLKILASESSTASTSFYVERQTYKIQLRIAYAAIFIGLIPFLFGKDSKEKVIANLAALLVIAGIYGLDANLADIDARAKASDQVFAKAIDSLSNLKQSNTIWYNLNGERLQSQFLTDSFEDSRRVSRKIQIAFFNWDFEQFIFYFVPLFFISLTSLFIKSKHQLI